MAPINDIELHGERDDEGSFRLSDLQVFENQNWQSKVRKTFDKTPFTFNVHLYNGRDGLVDFSELTPDTYKIFRVRHFEHLTAEHTHGEIPPAIVDRLTGKPRQKDGVITILLVENEGTNRRPLSPWILAHRVCHSIINVSQDFTFLFKSIVQGYGDNKRIGNEGYWMREEECFGKFACRFGTMRSCRDKTITETPYDFTLELLTQYLVQGKITLNRPPRCLKAYIDHSEALLNDGAELLLTKCVGKCFCI